MAQRKETLHTARQNGLRILILEDAPTDAELIECELRGSGLNFQTARVDARDQFLSALKRFLPDLILTDYSLPDFDGASALSLARENAPDVPFIFVTGVLGEERAVELLKMGATDFVHKDRLPRLSPSVSRALREAGEKRLRKEAEDALRNAHRELERKVEERTRELKASLALIQEKEERFWLSVETLLDAFCILSAVRDEERRIIDFRFAYINDAGCRIDQYSQKDHVQKSLLQLLPAHKENGLFEHFVNVVETGRPLILDGFIYEDFYGGGPRRAKAIDYRCARLGDGLAVSFRDVTERKDMEEELRQSRDGLEVCVQERTAELVESKEQLQYLSSQLLLAQEAERRRIARDIHDGLAANLSALKFDVETKIKKMKEGRPPDVVKLEEIQKFLQVNIDETRRIINNLRPSTLDDLGLLPTLSWLCREYEKVYTHIRVEKSIEIGEADVPEILKTVIFRVLQEALNNFAKHGRGDRVRLSLRNKGGGIHLHILDNGQGFDVETCRRGLGLNSMRERVELSGGSFTIESSPGAGTQIHVSWPELKREG
jgi:signal transduction histidine kinase/FixJ family two-component response regulator